MSTSHIAEAGTSQMLSCTLPEFRKRSHEYSNGIPEKESKRSKSLYHFVLASESEQPTDEDSESVHSIQARETDYAKDTTDTSSHDEWSADSIMEVEYEVAPSSDNDNPFDDNIYSSSCTDDSVYAENVIAAAIEDDLGLWADSSESDSGPTYDPEVPRKDYWTCVQCKCRNNNPLFRYCEKCFRLRKNFFPPRPRHKTRRRAPGALSPEAADKRSCEPAEERSFTPTEERSSPTPTEERTSPTPAGEACSLPANEVIEPAIVRTCSGITTDSGYNNSQREDSPLGSELCIICNVKPKNGIFVHNKIGHICCCYGCAVKVWKKRGKCPLCSQTPKQILKAFW